MVTIFLDKQILHDNLVKVHDQYIQYRLDMDEIDDLFPMEMVLFEMLEIKTNKI